MSTSYSPVKYSVNSVTTVYATKPVNDVSCNVMVNDTETDVWYTIDYVAGLPEFAQLCTVSTLRTATQSWAKGNGGLPFCSASINRKNRTLVSLELVKQYFANSKTDSITSWFISGLNQEEMTQLVEQLRTSYPGRELKAGNRYNRDRLTIDL